MFKRIGTQAPTCVHGKLLELGNACDECHRNRPKIVKSPLRVFGEDIQRVLDLSSVQVTQDHRLHPVWAGTLEEMDRGNLQFELSTGHPRERYEGTKFYLDMKLRIRHTVPWYIRAWRALTKPLPKPWDQEVGVHKRVQDGKVVERTDPELSYLIARGDHCPCCGCEDYSDHSAIEQELAGNQNVHVRQCVRCHRTYYLERSA